MGDDDTIVALSSGALPSGVAVIRISGSSTAQALTRLIGRLPEARRLTLTAMSSDGLLHDTGLAAWFPGPGSFTGEDCAELQVHGSPAVVKGLLRALTALDGIRLAEAGEFTRRAFENGKLDLTEAEGLGDLIAAETEGQKRQALTQLAGGLTDQLLQWRVKLLDARAEVEARLDFSDEGDVPDDLPATLLASLGQLRDELLAAARNVDSGRIVREGLRVALAGPPNAGKSSLLNALARSDVAIVTEEAGTTRDLREVALDLDGQLIVLIDMAGLRETSSKAEAEGVRRALGAIASADLVLWLVAPDAPALPPPDASGEMWSVASKCDLAAPASGLAVSSLSGTGISALLQQIKEFAAAATGSTETLLVSRERDRTALVEATESIEEALGLIGRDDLAAEALRRASTSLERLLGRVDAEAVLDRLFLGFCIGK